MHLIPAVLLALALAGVVAYDAVTESRPPVDSAGTNAASADAGLADPEPRLDIHFNPKSMRFGLTMTKERMPAPADDRFKQLTAKPDGESNNTCVMVEDPDIAEAKTGREILFGQPPGQFKLKAQRISKDRLTKSSWECADVKVIVTQTVQLVQGEQSRLLDTCWIQYTIENRDTRPHKVGLRVMIDTLIGAEDGVPFMVPGQSELIETQKVFTRKDMPDFLRAQEFPDPQNPGTIASFGLKLLGYEPLSELKICQWPNANVKWDWKLEPIKPPNAKPGEKGDSCVVLYWDYASLAAGQKRELAFTYGLGTVSSTSGRMGLASHGPTKPGGVFTVSASLRMPEKNQKVRIALPDGLGLEPGQQEEQTLGVVDAEKGAQVSWRVRAGTEGEYAIKVSSGTANDVLKVRINKGSIFN